MSLAEQITIVDGLEVLRRKALIRKDGGRNISYQDDARFDRLMQFAAKLQQAVEQHDTKLFPEGVDKKAAQKILSAHGPKQNRLIAETCWQQAVAENGPYDSKTKDAVNHGAGEVTNDLEELNQLTLRNGVINVSQIGKGSKHPERGLVCAEIAPEFAAMLATAGISSAKVINCRFRDLNHLTVFTNDAVAEGTPASAYQVYSAIIAGDLHSFTYGKSSLICINAAGQVSEYSNTKFQETTADAALVDKLNHLTKKQRHEIYENALSGHPVSPLLLPEPKQTVPTQHSH